MAGAAETGFADVNNASLYYETLGEGQALVLLHAGIADLRMWDPQFEAFARDFRVIRYDRRGFGRSEMVDGPFSQPDDLRGLLDHLGVERASFVGCSMGGAVAIDFVLGFPHRAHALVLVASAVGGYESDEPPPEEWDEIVAADEAGDLQRISELEVRMWVDGPRRGPEAVSPATRRSRTRDEPDRAKERGRRVGRRTTHERACRRAGWGRSGSNPHRRG